MVRNHVSEIILKQYLSAKTKDYHKYIISNTGSEWKPIISYNGNLTHQLIEPYGKLWL